jgi:gamma-glutamylcyclotransferase (GGCT)/AIG2-like uncharacterized protein YtfP
VLYFAYGSNLAQRAMLERAPRARPIIGALLREHVLVFESNEPAGAPDAYFANVRADANAFVPGALYEIDASDLDALDAYEDVARGVYERVTQSVERADGIPARAIVYHMRSVRTARFGLPSRAQLDQIRAGYADWGLDLRVFEAALESINSRMA